MASRRRSRVRRSRLAAQGSVPRLCAPVTSDPAEADDIVQEANGRVASDGRRVDPDLTLIHPILRMDDVEICQLAGMRVDNVVAWADLEGHELATRNCGGRCDKTAGHLRNPIRSRPTKWRNTTAGVARCGAAGEACSPTGY